MRLVLFGNNSLKMLVLFDMNSVKKCFIYSNDRGYSDIEGLANNKLNTSEEGNT